MKFLKGLLTGIVIGLLLGLWFGINLGRDKPLLSNPFAEATVQERLRQTGKTLIEKSGETLEKGGKALQESTSSGQ